MAKIGLFFLLFFLPLFSNNPPRAEVQWGVHAKAPPLTPDTLQKLAKIGIRFTFPAPRRNLGSNPSTNREGGLLFITDFNEKAEKFRKWLEMPEFRPGNISMGEDPVVELKETGGLGFDPSP
jgi:hypothetical protein